MPVQTSCRNVSAAFVPPVTGGSHCHESKRGIQKEGSHDNLPAFPPQPPGFYLGQNGQSHCFSTSTVPHSSREEDGWKQSSCCSLLESALSHHTITAHHYRHLACMMTNTFHKWLINVYHFYFSLPLLFYWVQFPMPALHKHLGKQHSKCLLPDFQLYISDIITFQAVAWNLSALGLYSR